MEQAPYWITATSYVFSLLPSLLHSNIRFLSALLLAYTPPVFASGVDFSCAFDVHKPHTSSPLAHMAIGLVHPVSNVSSFHFRSHPSQHFLPTLIRLPTFLSLKSHPFSTSTQSAGPPVYVLVRVSLTMSSSDLRHEA